MATALLLPPASPCLSSSSFLNSNGEPRNWYCVSIQLSKHSSHLKGFRVRALKEKTEKIENPSSSSKASAEEITKKYGLEAGLWKVGISGNETGEKVGTFALAYAAHKAASPIRFPPTVALTPVVAGWIGKIVGKEK